MAIIASVGTFDPHVLLLLFLPVLLFESAYSIDLAAFQRHYKQICLLAFPGVVVASVLTAAIIYAITQALWPGEDGWPFITCWLIGTIVSATDPVAVVALLKDLGTDKSLGTLIEGESLLNDGSAIVLYVVLRNWVYHHEEPLTDERQDPYIGGWLDLLRLIAQMGVLGPLFGCASGWVLSRVLQRVYNSKEVEVTLTLTTAYLVFWLAEVVMGSSAVLAVVFLALYLKHRSHLCISPEVAHVMHEFYELMAYLFNTAIFFIAGFKLGSEFSQLASATRNGVSWDGHKAQLLFFFLGWPIIQLTRALTMALFYPALTRLGEGCTWQAAVVMWWGGLRGSVGLALAMIVDHSNYSHKAWGGPTVEKDGYLPCRDIPETTLVITCSVVLWTVLINGTTVGSLMRKLELDLPPEERCFMLNKVYLTIHRAADGMLAKMKTEEGLSHVLWKRVEEALHRPDFATSLSRELHHPLKVAWREAIFIERCSYSEQYHRGTLATPAASKLYQALNIAAGVADTSLDRLEKLYDEHVVQMILRNLVPADQELSALRKLAKRLPMGIWRGIRRHALRGMAQRLGTGYEMALAYLHAHEEVLHAKHEMQRVWVA